MKESKSKKIMSTAELRQKIIYYQSEAAKYKFLSDKYELLLSKALQAKAIEEDFIEENSRTEQVIEKKISCTSYFNYSLIEDTESSPFIYGSYVIKNSGDITLESPIICLKVNDSKMVTISGKIGEISGATDKLIDSFDEWSYIHADWRKKWKESGEIWLKSKHTTKLEPGEKLVFSGFDISFKNIVSLKPILIDGFCYFQQITEGVKSLNSISFTPA